MYFNCSKIKTIFFCLTVTCAFNLVAEPDDSDVARRDVGGRGARDTGRPGAGRAGVDRAGVGVGVGRPGVGVGVGVGAAGVGVGAAPVQRAALRRDVNDLDGEGAVYYNGAYSYPDDTVDTVNNHYYYQAPPQQ